MVVAHFTSNACFWLGGPDVLEMPKGWGLASHHLEMVLRGIETMLSPLSQHPYQKQHTTAGCSIIQAS